MKVTFVYNFQDSCLSRSCQASSVWDLQWASQFSSPGDHGALHCSRATTSDVSVRNFVQRCYASLARLFVYVQLHLAVEKAKNQPSGEPSRFTCSGGSSWACGLSAQPRIIAQSAGDLCHTPEQQCWQGLLDQSSHDFCMT